MAKAVVKGALAQALGHQRPHVLCCVCLAYDPVRKQPPEMTSSRICISQDRHAAC
jgi:hypothetical protein